MGVPGLWEILRPAAEQRALTHLAVVDGFEANRSRCRGLRIGIDASIWFFHATYGKEGENPELRTLFFRCARLMGKPFLPLFVFDGPKRPNVKRGKRVGGKEHWMTSGMQRIIEAFGFEWRQAPGEAEAELAYLNRIGVIDAIISDDVDTFLFGAAMVIRNPSKSLSGNRGHVITNAAGKDDEEHVHTFKSTDILAHPDIGLSVGGLILIGLLRGGDYHQEGLPGCGTVIAHGLARCGFGDSLFAAAHSLPREDLDEFLVTWRYDVRHELRTNSRGYLINKRVALANKLPDSFPDVDILLSYTNPITSESETRGGRISYTWNREPDLSRIAGLCELFFEWGVKETIVKRFRTVMWAPVVLRILRRSVLNEDERQSKPISDSTFNTPKKKATGSSVKSPGTPSTMIARHFSSLKLTSPIRRNDDEEEDEDERLIVKVHGKREHASTDCVPEYRLEVAPAQLVRLTEGGIQGIRPPIQNVDDDDEEEGEDDGDGGKKKGPKKPPPEPTSHLRIWMPANMVRIVEPELVAEFEGETERKLKKKQDAAERKAQRAQGITTATKSTAKGGRKKKADVADKHEDAEDAEDFSDIFGLKKSYVQMPSKSKPSGKENKIAKPKTMTAFAEDEDDKSDEGEDVFKPKQSAKPRATARAKQSTSMQRSTTLPPDDPIAPTQPKPLILRRTQTAPSQTSSAAPATLSSNPSKIALSRDRSRSALLEMLDEIEPGASARAPSAASSAGAGTSRSGSFAPPSSYTAPFPLSISDSEDDDLELQLDTGKLYKPPRNTRKVSSRTSDSDSANVHTSPKKSPRKSKTQVSPRSKYTTAKAVRQEEKDSPEVMHRMMKPLAFAQARKTAKVQVPLREEEEESDDDVGRPPSPSPFRTRTLPKSSAEVGSNNAIKASSQREKPPAKGPVTYIEISSDSDEEKRPVTKQATAVKPTKGDVGSQRAILTYVQGKQKNSVKS